MKELLLVASLLMIGVAGEDSAPYPASGWKPEGPAFELPQARGLQKQQYLPPVDPRSHKIPNSYDDNVDVSVQGLPTVEQQPIFQLSPINGQQITGPSFQLEVAKLNPSLQQQQYQQQLEKSIQFARQREFDAGRRPSNGLPNQQSPRQFASSSTTTTIKPEFKTTQSETTTESLNQGETLEDDRDFKNNKEKVSVEITKQNLQEYPPELFLSPLAQLNLQQQFVPLSQLAQIRAPLYYQPQTEKLSQGFSGPAHLSALPSVLAQRELLSQQFLAPNQGFAQSPIVVQEQSLVQEPLNSYAPNVINQYQALNQYQPQQQQVQNFPQFKLPTQHVILQPQGDQIQPIQFQPQQPNQLQPQQPNQLQPQQPDQFQYQQPSQFQPQQPDQFQYQQPNQFAQQQPNQFQPQQPDQFQYQQSNQFAQQLPKDVEEVEQNDQQVVLQNYQPQFYQPQYQPNLVAQPASNYPNQDVVQLYQPQFEQLDPRQYQAQVQGQGLQSGLDLNQEGNGIEDNEESELNDKEQVEEGSRATAVATAFGTRTQPRVIASYGSPIPKVQATQIYPTTTEYMAQEEPTTVDAPAVAQATAIAGGRRNAKIRSRRIRPIFTLDRSGHLVLAQQ